MGQAFDILWILKIFTWMQVWQSDVLSHESQDFVVITVYWPCILFVFWFYDVVRVLGELIVIVQFILKGMSLWKPQ